MLSLQEKRDRVNGLIVFHLKTYVLGDLDILDTIQPDPVTGLKGCGIPTAMLIISTIKLMGFLMRDVAPLSDSENNISYALNYKDYFPAEYRGHHIASTLTVIYRHGMMHFFFPKQSRANKKYALSKTTDQRLFIDINHGNELISSLNINVLSRDFRAFLMKIFNEIDTSTDETLLDNIIKSFGKVDDVLMSDNVRMQNITTQTTMSPPNMVNKK